MPTELLCPPHAAAAAPSQRRRRALCSRAFVNTRLTSLMVINLQSSAQSGRCGARWEAAPRCQPGPSPGLPTMNPGCRCPAAACRRALSLFLGVKRNASACSLSLVPPAPLVRGRGWCHPARRPLAGSVLPKAPGTWRGRARPIPSPSEPALGTLLRRPAAGEGSRDGLSGTATRCPPPAATP